MRQQRTQLTPFEFYDILDAYNRSRKELKQHIVQFIYKDL